ncbi:MAG: M48 family metallopeptidase [Elusimicrobia bacterium]|nr:M48 family metallopeptidase [Elusimicrobiota bacterium]
MNLYLLAVVVFLVGTFTVELIADYLNIKNISQKLPEEFEGVYDAQKYAKSQRYLVDKTVFSTRQSAFMLVISLLFIFFGGFNTVDLFARSFGFGTIGTGLIFMLCLYVLIKIITLPFRYYNTFVLEQKYGFNKTTLKTFISDTIKSFVLTVILGAPMMVMVIWFFIRFGTFAWLWAFAAVAAFQLLLTFVAPVLIMPLFNKYTPLEDGELKTSVEAYAKKENFKMKGLFKMDGSKRSSKSNAFFTGFGKFRRIVLFDTLIEKHTTPELTAVLAHEMGHYKKGHIFKFIMFSLAQGVIIFFLLSLFINSRGLFEAFNMQYMSVYAGLVLFGFLYSPVSFVLGIIGNYFSRKYEYEADAYVVKTYQDAGHLIDALKKLSADNLSNLTPHKFKVFTEYTHPPVLKRINAIKSQMSLK